MDGQRRKQIRRHGSLTQDAAGRLTKTVYSDGTTIPVAYNADGFFVSTTGLTIERKCQGQGGEHQRNRDYLRRRRPAGHDDVRSRAT